MLHLPSWTAGSGWIFADQIIPYDPYDLEDLELGENIKLECSKVPMFLPDFTTVPKLVELTGFPHTLPFVVSGVQSTTSLFLWLDAVLCCSVWINAFGWFTRLLTRSPFALAVRWWEPYWLIQTFVQSDKNCVIFCVVRKMLWSDGVNFWKRSQVCSWYFVYGMDFPCLLKLRRQFCHPKCELLAQFSVLWKVLPVSSVYDFSASTYLT